MICVCGCGEEIPAKHLFRYKAPYLLRGHRLETPLCACGCGERITWSPNLRYLNLRFIKGHDKRKPVEPQLCACGCGGFAYAGRGVVRKYISGHNAVGRVFKQTEEGKAKIRAARAVQQNVSGIKPHGMSRSPTYKSWVTMLWRCRDPRDISYPRYGGRGIIVCGRWEPRKGGSFLNFLADMGERPEGMTLDRRDNDGNYEPSNCRWATKAEQTANRRDSWITRRANHAS